MNFKWDLNNLMSKADLSSEELSREEIRRKRKKQEQIQAYGVLGGGILVIFIILFIIMKSIMGPNVSKDTQNTQNTVVKESAVETKEEVVQESETAEEEVSAAEQVAKATAQKKAEEEKAAEEAEPDYNSILDNEIEKYISDMTIEEKVAALFWVTPEQLTNANSIVESSSILSEALINYPVGGLIFSERNMENPDQFLEMLSNIRASCKYETFMAICDEGGKSSPFYTKKFVEEPGLSQEEVAKGGVSEAYSSGIAYGNLLRAYGLDTNFAPMADVVSNKGTAVGKRSYGTDVDKVAALAKNTMNGMHDQMIHSVVKYFPCYYDTGTDGTNGKISSNRTEEDLKKTDMEVFKQLVNGGAEMIMVSVQAMPKITNDTIPACFSDKIVTGYLREELGFEGIIMTDYMSKSAISKSYKQNTIAIQAILAGCDMVVSPSHFDKQYESVVEAVKDGTITEERIEESIYRIYRIKYRNLINYEEAQE